MSTMQPHRVVVVGGGFGGLYTISGLRRAPVEITLVDRRNFHLFQPLLYQVSTGGLSPADIASPLRHIFKKQRNVTVILGEATDVDPERKLLRLTDRELPFDSLVLAPGVVNHYFGQDQWAGTAPGLKTLEDAVEIRHRILESFEAAELEADAARRAALMTFVVVGAGPTGVELAGAIGELAHHTLRGEFRRIDPTTARVLLVDGADRVLPGFPELLSARAARSLKRLRVEVRTGTRVVRIDADGLDLERNGATERITTRTVLWGAGVAAPPLARALQAATGCELDRMGRVRVGPDLAIPGHPDIYVIGDMAHVEVKGKPLPCIAPPAVQGGKHVAKLIRARLQGRAERPAFRYFDKGSLATIGRSAAVAEFRGLKFWGFPAWMLWLVVHIVYLIGFENRAIVMFQWINMYIMKKRGARIILARSDPPGD
jgi:NADH:ubiquinone reductase (H+-translocating)